MDDTRTIKFLLNKHRGEDKTLKQFLFDGTMLFSPNRYVLGDNVMNLTSKRQEVLLLIIYHD